MTLASNCVEEAHNKTKDIFDEIYYHVHDEVDQSDQKIYKSVNNSHVL